MSDSNTTNSTTRRTLLTALPAAGISLALPAAGQAKEPEDPILSVYREWKAARVRWIEMGESLGYPVQDPPERLAEEKRWHEAFNIMIDMKPQTMAGAAAMVHVLWDLESPPNPKFCDVTEELKQPHYKMLIALWQFTTGRDDLPPAEDMMPLI